MSSFSVSFFCSHWNSYCATIITPVLIFMMAVDIVLSKVFFAMRWSTMDVLVWMSYWFTMMLWSSVEIRIAIRSMFWPEFS